jgi:hypothetical protein
MLLAAFVIKLFSRYLSFILLYLTASGVAQFQWEKHNKRDSFQAVLYILSVTLNGLSLGFRCFLQSA